jgi:hypothetical protein
MIIALEIKDIRPRLDMEVIVKAIQSYLDQCDPDDRPDLRIECPA